MERLGVEPRETLMIGDTTHDLELARNAGVDAVAVAYGAHDVDGLALARAARDCALARRVAAVARDARLTRAARATPE